MITWKHKRIPCFYLFLYKLMREKSNQLNHGLYLDHQHVKEIFRRNMFNVPNIYYALILKEMRELKMLRRVGGGKYGFRYEFLGKDMDKLLNQYNFF